MLKSKNQKLEEKLMLKLTLKVKEKEEYISQKLVAKRKDPNQNQALHLLKTQRDIKRKKEELVLI